MYQTNVPVTAEAFYNRKSELSALVEGLTALRKGAPSWIALLGPRKIGKTSLLLELNRRVAELDLVFVMLDSFEDYPLTWEVFRTFGLRTLDAFISADLGLSLRALVRKPSSYRQQLQHSQVFGRLPAALRGEILELPERLADRELARTVLAWPEALADASQRWVVVAWDEFQELAELAKGRGGQDPFPLMRSVWQRHRRVSYIISGSARTMLMELITSERSPFFQHFSLTELSPFASRDARQLLIDAAPDDRPLPPELAQRVVDILGGHPFYLQLLGEQLVGYAPPYDEATLKEALGRLLFSRTGRLALYFEQQFTNLVGRAATLSATLNTLANEPLNLSSLARAIGTVSGAAARYIERLGDAIVRNESDRYLLADPTFALWLRWRRPGGTVVPMSVVGDDAERAVAASLAGLGFDLVYQSRASRGAFDLLATRGAHQLGIQVKRSVLPLRFGRSAWKRMQAEGKRLGWHWVVVSVAPETSNEITFLDPGRVRRGKEYRLTAVAAIDNLLAWLDARPS